MGDGLAGYSLTALLNSFEDADLSKSVGLVGLHWWARSPSVISQDFRHSIECSLTPAAGTQSNQLTSLTSAVSASTVCP